MPKINLIRKINITLSTLGLIILVFDLKVTNEFKMESAYVIGVFTLLIFNIYSQLKSSIRSVTLIKKITNTCMLALVSYNLFTVLILSFGVGFTGREFPLIMTITALYNFIFVLFIIYDLGLNQKNKLDNT